MHVCFEFETLGDAQKYDKWFAETIGTESEISGEGPYEVLCVELNTADYKACSKKYMNIINQEGDQWACAE